MHSACDPEADRQLVQRKKELNVDYEYQCPTCKHADPSDLVRMSSDPSGLGDDYTDSSDVLMLTEEASSGPPAPASMLVNASSGGSKPRGGKVLQSAGKIARKRISGAAAASVGRPKGSGKTQLSGGVGASGGGGLYTRKPKAAEYGRKRGPKPKMRGVFGAPGVGLQRPQASVEGSNGNSVEGEPCLENRLVLCSAQDRFVLEQDACVMCGAFGLDAEGRLIACAQCGQCYHPYCANVKVNTYLTELT